MPYIGNEVTQGRFKSVEYTATADQTTFPSSGALPESAVSGNQASVLVKVNGLLFHTDAYSIGSTLVFTAGLDAGDKVEIVWLGLEGVAGGVPTDNSVTNAKLARAGTSGQVLTSAGTGADATWSDVAPMNFLVKTNTDYTVTTSDLEGYQHLWIHCVNTSGSTKDVILLAPTNFTNKIISVAFMGSGVSGDDIKVWESDGSTELDGMSSGTYSTRGPDRVSYWSDGTNYRLMYKRYTGIGGGL